MATDRMSLYASIYCGRTFNKMLIRTSLLLRRVFTQVKKQKCKEQWRCVLQTQWNAQKRSRPTWRKVKAVQHTLRGDYRKDEHISVSLGDIAPLCPLKAASLLATTTALWVSHVGNRSIELCTATRSTSQKHLLCLEQLPFLFTASPKEYYPSQQESHRIIFRHTFSNR